MRVDHYLARAKQETKNIATHHDTDKAVVEAGLADLKDYIVALEASLGAERGEYYVNKISREEAELARSMEALRPAPKEEEPAP